MRQRYEVWADPSFIDSDCRLKIDAFSPMDAAIDWAQHVDNDLAADISGGEQVNVRVLCPDGTEKRYVVFGELVPHYGAEEL